MADILNPAPRLDHAALLSRAASFVAAGRPVAARPLLATLRRANVETVGVAILAVRIDVAEGRVDAALETIGTAMAAVPEDARLYALRADVLARAGRIDAALRDAAEVVCRLPRDIDARGGLGLLLLEAGRREEALTVLADVWRDAPWHRGVTEALALAHEVGGDAEAAHAVLTTAITQAPGEPWPHTALMLLHLRAEAPERAMGAGLAAQAGGITDPQLLGLLAHACALCGAHDAARSALGSIAPGDAPAAEVEHLSAMAALGTPPAGDRWPAAYARDVFDAFADRFDARLSGLVYRAPERIRDLLRASAQPGGGPVLDLGCGTGLVAAAIAPLALGPIEGVDVSPKMLALARETGLYAALAEADLADFLAAQTSRFAVACAADVFCYLGDLAPVLGGVARCLIPGGIAVFTVEAAAGAELADGARPWVRRRSGRYAHTETYLRATLGAASLTIVSLERHALRNEYGRTLEGYYVVARRTHS